MKKLRRLALFSILVMLVVWLFSPRPTPILAGSVLALELGGAYVERAEPSLLARLTQEAEQPLAQLLGELAKAERDERLRAVVLRLRSLDIGWAKAQEVRSAIQRVSAAGRRTVVSLELESLTGNLEYYVASAADEIHLNPGTRVPLVGLAGEYFFLGGLFEKLGIELEVERIGRYKTGADTLAGREMSESHREMVTALLDSIDAQFVSGVAEGRGIPEAAVRAAIDATPIAPADLEAHGLIDGVATARELVERWKQGKGDAVTQARYRAVTPEEVGFAPAARIALVYGSGNVVSGKGDVTPSGAPVLASETLAQAFEDAAKDPAIDAIVFRIDSPGGSALASEVIWQATARARAGGKPFVASFSDVAASGGYYVAAGADAIVAAPASITGSIGVYVLRPMIADLLSKLDIGVATETRGKHAGLQLSSQPLDASARKLLGEEVASIYALFLERVAAGRALETAAVDAVAQGRVWTGAQALEHGLVDELGGLREALRRAKQLAGLDVDADVELVPYPQPKPLAAQLGELFAMASAGRPSATPAGLGDAWLRDFEPWLAAVRDPRVSALLPFSVRIR